MPILATGNNKQPIATGALSNTYRISIPAGFTLMEIMLVLLIMAVVSAMVIPNLFSPSSAGLADEGRYLGQVLQLAAEESQMEGIPLRWSVYVDRYVFEIPDAEGGWQIMHEKPFAPHRLSAGIHMASVQLQDGLLPPEQAEEKDPPLGHVVFFPDGMLTLADVTITSETDQLTVQLRPGSGGIHLVENRE